MYLIILGVLEEARFYGIEGVITTLEEIVADNEKRSKGTVAITRRDVLKAIMSTPPTSQLRFQGVNLIGADLSRLDLRNINFKVLYGSGRCIYSQEKVAKSKEQNIFIIS